MTSNLGRGIKIVFTTTPSLNESGQVIVRRTIYDDKKVFGKYFEDVYVTASNDRIIVFCTDPKFYVDSSDPEKTYNQIFYKIIERISDISSKVLLKSVNLSEFYLLYQTKPQEELDKYMPLIKLRTIWAFIFLKSLLSLDSNKYKETNLTKRDQEKFKELSKKMKLEKDFLNINQSNIWHIHQNLDIIGKNADFIIGIAMQLGLWKPYTKEDIANISEESSKSSESFKPLMPLTDTDLKLINETIFVQGSKVENPIKLKIKTYFSEISLLNEYLELMPKKTSDELKLRFKKMAYVKGESVKFDKLYYLVSEDLSSNFVIINTLEDKILNYRRTLEQRDNQIKQTRYFKSIFSLFSRNKLLDSEENKFKKIVDALKDKKAKVVQIKEENFVENITKNTGTKNNPDLIPKKKRETININDKNVLTKIKFRYYEYVGKNEASEIKEEYNSALAYKMVSIKELLENLDKSIQKTLKSNENVLESRKELEKYIYQEDKYYLNLVKQIKSKELIDRIKGEELIKKLLSYSSVPICKKNACNEEAVYVCDYCKRIFCELHSEPVFTTSLSEKASTKSEEDYSLYKKIQTDWAREDGHPCPNYRESWTSSHEKPKYRTRIIDGVTIYDKFNR